MPPSPPAGLQYPNGYYCPLRCSSPTLRMAQDAAVPVCVPPQLNGNLGGAVAGTVWQYGTEDHCENVVRPGAEKILNTSRQVCDWVCTVDYQMAMTDPACNERCSPLTVSCDACSAACSPPVCVPSWARGASGPAAPLWMSPSTVTIRSGG